VLRNTGRNVVVVHRFSDVNVVLAFSLEQHCGMGKVFFHFQYADDYLVRFFFKVFDLDQICSVLSQLMDIAT